MSQVREFARPIEGDHGLRRVLGPVDATCVVIGAIIGVGIFFTPGQVAQYATTAPLAMLAWVVGGVIALLGALTFAELGGLYPRSGGQYEILRDAYGPAPAFLFVFCNATAIQAGATAIIAIVCAEHLGQMVGRELLGLPLLVCAGLLIAGLVGANCLGVRFGSGVQNLTVFAKVTTLMAVTVLALVHGSTGTVNQAVADIEPARGLGIVPAIFAALVPAFFAFGGWQHALWMAGEVRRPRRDVPLSIIGGVVIVVVVYLMVNWAYLALLGYDGVVKSKALAADAVAVAFPGVGRQVIAGAVAVSAFGVLNAQLLSGPRLVYGMAHDGRFFRVFAVTSVRFGTPIAAIILIGAMATLLLVSTARGGLGMLLAWVVIIDGVFFAMTGAALIILRKRFPDADRPVRVPLYPLVPVLFVIAEIGIVTFAAIDPTLRIPALIGALWMLGGLACYLIWFRNLDRPDPAGEAS